MQESSTSQNNFYEEYSATTVMSKPNSIEHYGYYSYIKRIADLLLSLLCLPITLFVIGVFAILIKLESSGPVFFRQERVGLNGRYFYVIKLRSMYENAEAKGAVWAQKDDPRVTKVGKFIRKTRIDELPQLFNVIKGDMSIVGPRPERPMFTAQFEEKYPGFINRLTVKPGITGWAQVNGGYDISPKEKLKLDMYYIKNIGLMLDIKILMKTIKVIITGDGAR